MSINEQRVETRENDALCIRFASTTTEAAWINARYAEIGFMTSDLHHERVALAEFSSSPAGLGRLVAVTPTTTELGGILVLEEFRGRGVAAAIVQFLVQNHQAQSQLFCMPFVHLCAFYERFGFQRVQPDASTPQPLLEKLEWCNGQYEAETCLMERS